MLTHTKQLPCAPARLVVLGAGGFLGRALLRQASVALVPTLALSRAQVDLTTVGAGVRLAAMIRADDAVVVLAAITPDRERTRAAFIANMRIGDAIATALEQTAPAHVTYVSSDAVYSFADAPITETTAAAPSDLYGAMHLAREFMIATSTTVPVAILRSTMLYGAEDTHNAYGPNRFLRQAKREGRIVLFGAGEELRDTLAVEDAASLILQVIVHGSYGALNLASSQSVSHVEMAKRVAACFPTPIQLERAPQRIPVAHRRFDVSAIRRAFPYFVFTPLDEGLARAARAI